MNVYKILLMGIAALFLCFIAYLEQPCSLCVGTGFWGRMQINTLYLVAFGNPLFVDLDYKNYTDTKENPECGNGATIAFRSGVKDIVMINNTFVGVDPVICWRKERVKQ